MEEQLFTLILSAIACAPIVSGIIQVIKKHTNIAGIGIIILAPLTGITLFGAVALVFGFPVAESLLLGVLTGFASIGAFEGFKKVKGYTKQQN